MTRKEFSEWVDDEGGFMSLVRHGFDSKDIDDVETRRRVEEALPSALVIKELEEFLYAENA